jgi:hypothetical protein
VLRSRGYVGTLLLVKWDQQKWLFCEATVRLTETIRQFNIWMILRVTTVGQVNRRKPLTFSEDALYKMNLLELVANICMGYSTCYLAAVRRY